MFTNLYFKAKYLATAAVSITFLSFVPILSLAQSADTNQINAFNQNSVQNQDFDRIIVKYRSSTPETKKKDFEKLVGTKSNHIKNITKIDQNQEIYDLKDNQKDQISKKNILKTLQTNPDVEYAEPDYKIALSESTIKPIKSVAPATIYTNDQLNQWHLNNINTPSAWDYSTGQGVLVAVCDTGVEKTHPDLVHNLRADLGYNIYTGSPVGWDVLENPHGTMVAGTIAETANNTVGGKGVAFNAKIMPLKVSFDSTGSTYTSNLATCIQYAADKGAKVINVSYNAAGSVTVANAATYANSKGASVVIAAGNSGSNLPYTNFPSLIAVSATTETNSLASFSDYGSFVDVSAPGTNIVTTYWNGGYASASGTSFSSPITAGVIALILQARPTLTPDQIQSLLKSTATDLGAYGYDIHYGYGKVNAQLAVNTALGYRTR